MITISVNENLVTFTENGTTIKEIKKASRNAQLCFVKKTGVENFDWKTEWDLKLKNAAEKFISATPATKPTKEVKVEETEQAEATPETTGENIKATAEIASDGKVEETIDGGDGQSITIVH